MRGRFSVKLVLLFGLGTAAACGGSIATGKDSSEDSFDDGGSNGGSDDEGGIGSFEGSIYLPDGGFLHDCPEATPDPGTPCTINGSQCEYGTDLFISCNTLAVCQEGAWIVEEPSTKSSICSKTYVNPPDCPATSSDVPVGGDCSTPQTCLYMDSNPQLCTCAPDNLGDYEVWGCYQPQAGCPAFPNRPRLGTLCSTEDLECNYGSCGNSTNVECFAGEWGVGGDPCDLNGG